MRRAATLFCAGLALCQAAFAFDYLSQFKPGDYPYDLAVEMQAQRCTMTERHMARFLAARGATISDVQATILNLAKAGNLIWDTKQSYTLVGWGRCR